MIIAVADLHLGSPIANKSGFFEFIREFLEPNQDDISRIVLLGDILDLWRNTNSEVLLNNLDVLAELGRLDMKKNYLAGNHDYAIFSILNQSSASVPPDSKGVLANVSESLELKSDGQKLKFIHGHQIDYWPSLRFYEIFSQAMCFVDKNEQELSDVWSIINQFAENLPESSRNRLRGLSRETQNALEQKLAGPIDGIVEGEKTGLYFEWELIRKISDFEEVSLRTAKPLKAIEKFADEWEEILKIIDQYSAMPFLPPDRAYEVHQKRREAADLSVGLQNDQFLIRGHGHSPYVSQESMIADSGCWLGDIGSYLKIVEGQVSVHRW